ncbi:MAG: LD-carboxypeptidase [Candidatus Coatesbacteria bacterium]|nr:LD-carboxypeptidase [Candidatus Coatesbacteria bacterium]
MIGIVAPCGPVDRNATMKACRFLEEKGYRIKLAPHLFESCGYFAGTDRQRASDFNLMFEDREIEAIFIARGGYGSARILPYIDYGIVRQNPKILVGYSDATALQLALFSENKLVSFYGPVVSLDFSGASAQQELDHMMLALSAEPGTGLFPAPLPDSVEILSHGRSEGTLIGGCLSVLVSLLGSEHFPDMRDAVLFLEDIDEPPYRIDRYLTQLELSGVLSGLSGVLLGAFVDCIPRRDGPSFSVEEVLEERFLDCGYPVVSGLPFGHIAEKATLAQGVRAAIDTDDLSLTYLMAACDASVSL